MIVSEDPRLWARHFGLAMAPLFEHETEAPGTHAVLLDGANGSFAMSLSDEELWRNPGPANWIWSSDVAHHVTVTAGKVAVLRWDRPADARVFERGSIERNLDRFTVFFPRTGCGRTAALSITCSASSGDFVR